MASHEVRCIRVLLSTGSRISQEDNANQIRLRSPPPDLKKKVRVWDYGYEDFIEEISVVD